MASTDADFVGSIPEVYASLLVPMIFSEPARALAATIAALQPTEVLETAAGTGVLTRELLDLPGVEVVATDLNPDMLAVARAGLGSERVRWRVADATRLPFADATFDVVACQFGVMFFPDRVRGYAEAARVLRPGGTFAFTVWDRIETSPVVDVITRALADASPADSFDFPRRTPHGHGDPDRLRADLDAAGFVDVRIEVLDGTSRSTAGDGAVAFCQGTPLRGEIERSNLSLEQATEVATAALTDRFGAGTFDAPTRWLQLLARRP